MSGTRREIKIKMTVNYTPYNKGQVVTMDSRKAEVLVDIGVAEKVVVVQEK